MGLLLFVCEPRVSHTKAFLARVPTKKAILLSILPSSEMPHHYKRTAETYLRSNRLVKSI
jgi:hypothetical protein